MENLGYTDVGGLVGLGVHQPCLRDLFKEKPGSHGSPLLCGRRWTIWGDSLSSWGTAGLGLTCLVEGAFGKGEKVFRRECLTGLGVSAGGKGWAFRL